MRNNRYSNQINGSIKGFFDVFPHKFDKKKLQIALHTSEEWLLVIQKV